MSPASIPALNDDPRTHRRAIERMRQEVDVLAGRRGTINQRALVVQDAIDAGVLRVGPDGQTLFRPNGTTIPVFNDQTAIVTAPALATARGTLDASAGLAIGTVNAGISLPIGAIVWKAFYDVATTFTSATDAATIRIGIETDSPAGIVAAIAISNVANPWDAGNHDCIQTGLAANFATQTAAARQIQFTVAVEALTAGLLYLYVSYFVSP